MMGDEAAKIPRQDEPFLFRWQPQEAHLGQFKARMQPWSIAAEQYLFRSTPSDRLLEQVESAYSGGIGINIGMSRQMVDQCQLGLPLVGKAPEMGNDEIHVGILPRQELHH